jgi:hypothetical protein
MQQKLYTEEQVRNAFIDGMKFIAVHPLKYEQDANGYMDSLTPIELPSDEDIDIEAFRVTFDDSDAFFDLFIKGAKWMKEQILKIK